MSAGRQRVEKSAGGARSASGWKRRVGAFPTPGFRLYPGDRVLDGGRDAPLDERGRRIWHLTLAVVLVLGALVLLLSVLSYLHH
jgi:hypothetical protein